jgi:hypothetical protein
MTWSRLAPPRSPLRERGAGLLERGRRTRSVESSLRAGGLLRAAAIVTGRDLDDHPADAHQNTKGAPGLLGGTQGRGGGLQGGTITAATLARPGVTEGTTLDHDRPQEGRRPRRSTLISKSAEKCSMKMSEKFSGMVSNGSLNLRPRSKMKCMSFRSGRSPRSTKESLPSRRW